jgi:Arc/MetJ-type ribon-helix-helix transcriptional regulator
MSTHRITVDIPDAAYKTLREAVEAGDYGSESELIESLLKRYELGAFETEEERNDWLRDEVIPAYDEAEAHPESLLSGEQVLAYLEERRTLRNKASNAA